MRFILIMVFIGMLNTLSLYGLRAAFGIEIDWASLETWALSFLLSFGWIQSFKLIGIDIIPSIPRKDDDNDFDA